MSDVNLKPIFVVIISGAILGGIILGWGEKDLKSETGSETAVSSDLVEKQETGPRGGKIFISDNFSLEVTIFEQGIEPHFRLYVYDKGKPIAPKNAKVAMTLSRLGRPVQLFDFKPTEDYLLSEQEVEEPHSYDATITAEWQGKSFHWGYSQVEARIEMSEETLTRAGIVIQTAGPTTIRPTLLMPGVIIFNHHNIVRVVPRAPGIVIEVPRHLGDQVAEGVVLAVLESQLLADWRSQYLAAQKRLVLADANFKREKQLWEEKITAKQEYLTTQQLLSEAEITLELAAARLRSIGEEPEAIGKLKNLTRYEVRAPIDGLITAKDVARGQVIKEDSEIFTIVDTSTMYADLTVYPKDLGAIKLGQQATIKTTASNIKGTGEIMYITPMLDAQTRTAMARVTLDNSSGLWRDGMFVNGAIRAEEIEVPVAVDVNALQTLFDWTVVFGRYGDYFEARPLKLGNNDGEVVEVLHGLLAGEKYAAKNSFAVKAELGKSGAEHDH